LNTNAYTGESGAGNDNRKIFGCLALSCHEIVL
jgi:hypothetical protein